MNTKCNCGCGGCYATDIADIGADVEKAGGLDKIQCERLKYLAIMHFWREQEIAMLKDITKLEVQKQKHNNIAANIDKLINLLQELKNAK